MTDIHTTTDTIAAALAAATATPADGWREVAAALVAAGAPARTACVTVDTPLSARRCTVAYVAAGDARDVRIDGDEARDVIVAGDGRGHAYRDGAGDGDAYRVGAGAGSAYRSGAGAGHAYRDGDGDGDGGAVRDGERQP
jgi:hypothetical protein